MKFVGPLSRGLSNAEIAAELGYELHTIENYVSELRELLGVPDRPRLMLRLLQLTPDGEVAAPGTSGIGPTVGDVEEPAP
jgi:hypothetical protein